jgi:hypothetical protein
MKNNSPKMKSQKTGAKTIFLVIRNLKNLKNVQVCSAQFSTLCPFFSLWNFFLSFYWGHSGWGRMLDSRLFGLSDSFDKFKRVYLVLCSTIKFKFCLKETFEVGWSIQGCSDNQTCLTTCLTWILFDNKVFFCGNLVLVSWQAFILS